jgi:hypothetical protein
MRTSLLSVLAALALAGCSSSSNSTPTQLTYTDPSPTGWRLVKDPASTPSRLVLALVGPAGTQARGVGFNLQAGTTVRWSTFDSGLPIQDTGVFELKNTQPDPNLPPDPYEEVLLDGGVMDGNILTVGIFQKDRRASAKDATAPLLRIALEIDAKGQSGTIPLEMKKAKLLPADIGGYNDDPALVMSKSRLDKVVIAVGTLQAS